MIRILLIIGGVVVVVAATWFFVSPQAVVAPVLLEDESIRPSIKEETAPLVQNNTGTGSLADAMLQRESGFCTFISANNGSETEGKFWFTKTQYALEAVSRVDGELYTSNMIYNGTETFVWGGTAAGSMAVVFESESTSVPTQAVPVNRFDLNEMVSYDCGAMEPEPVKFLPPGNIVFTNYSAMIDGSFEGQLRGQPEGMDFMPPESN